MTDPVIIVGDSSGVTHSLKLSPNLRSVRLGTLRTYNHLLDRKKTKEMLKAEKNEDDKLLRRLEREKLERLVQQVEEEKDTEEEEEGDGQ